MNRSPQVTLPALLAWAALCLPWQICVSDCRTAVVGGWKHDCHLPTALGGCAGHCHDEGDDPHGDRCQRDDSDGNHTKLQIPVREPGESGVGTRPPPPCFADCICGSAERDGLAKRILARCTGPPGSFGNKLPRLRSVVLLL